jgi:hypothetical protein
MNHHMIKKITLIFTLLMAVGTITFAQDILKGKDDLSKLSSQIDNSKKVSLLNPSSFSFGLSSKPKTTLSNSVFSSNRAVSFAKTSVPKSFIGGTIENSILNFGGKSSYQPQTSQPISKSSISGFGTSTNKIINANDISIITNPTIRPRTKDKDKKKERQGYYPLVKDRGNFIKVNNKVYDYAGAFNSGASVVDNSASATFKIVKTNKTPQETKVFGNFYNNKFTKSRKNNNLFTEKNRFRIDTLGELQGITAKGLIAKKNKSMF